MITPAITATYAGNKPLSVLSDLIRKRREILGESAKDAVVATAIDALVSIRAATKTAAGKKKTKPKIEDTSWYGSYSNSTGRPCFRSGVGKYSKRIEVPSRRVKWLVAGVRRENRHVYRVTPEHGKVAPYYVVCQSPEIADAFEQLAAKHRTDEYGDLAKHALGVAMYKISTRNVASRAGVKARMAASKLAKTIFGDTPAGGYFVSIDDELEYAISALKNDRATVDIAIKKAANKIAGRLAKEVAGRPFMDRIETPFPEVRRRAK